MWRVFCSAILSLWRGKGEFKLFSNLKKVNLSNRFRGLLPVVIDVETSGLDPARHALLELAAVTLAFNAVGKLCPDQIFHYQVEAYPGAPIDPAALDVTGIDPEQPLRYAIPEQQALRRLFVQIRRQLELNQCNRGVLVGHNAWFDLSFLQSAVKRSAIGHVPLHSFTTFDTATLAGVALGETILARAVKKAGLGFDVAKAHSAIYDATKTAELFCYIANSCYLPA
jgi:ribonuclease T